MPLEDLTGPNAYLDALNVAWPLGSDPKYEGDDHIRGVKNVVVNTLGALNQPLYNPDQSGALVVPRGTTAERPPGSAERVGDLRRNTSTGRWEQWNGSAWVNEIAQLNADAGEQAFEPRVRFEEQVSQLSTEAGAAAGPYHYNRRARPTQTVGEPNLGRYMFRGKNDAGTEVDVCGMAAVLTDVDEASMSGEFWVGARTDNTFNWMLRIGESIFAQGAGGDVGVPGAANFTDYYKGGEEYHKSYAPTPTTSGSSQQQTGLRASKKQVVVWLKDVSTTGTASIELKLGTSAGYPASGYDGNVVSASTAVGVSSWPADAISCNRAWGSTQNLSGTITLTRVGDSNSWIVQGSTGMTAGAGGFTQYQFNGYVDLPGELDRVQLETGNAFNLGEFGVQVIG